jgi:hypothetical protein
MDQDTLTAIVASKRELDGMPVVSGASFGHTTPQFTFPTSAVSGRELPDTALVGSAAFTARSGLRGWQVSKGLRA